MEFIKKNKKKIKIKKLTRVSENHIGQSRLRKNMPWLKIKTSISRAEKKAVYSSYQSRKKKKNSGTFFQNF